MLIAHTLPLLNHTIRTLEILVTSEKRLKCLKLIRNYASTILYEEK